MLSSRVKTIKKNGGFGFIALWRRYNQSIFKPLEFDGFIYFQHVILTMNTDFDIVAFAKTLSTELSKVTDKGINITFNINVYTDSSEKKCSCHSNRKSLAIPKNSRFASRRPRPYETRKLNGGDLSHVFH